MTVPDAIKRSYMLRDFNAGIPVEPDNSVFDALAYPPTTGVDAVQASVEAAKEIGIIQPDAEAIKRLTSHRDSMLDFYDAASYVKDTDTEE